jgi:hypothetical protein
MMRRPLVSIVAGIAVLSVGSLALAADSTYNAHLKGENERPDPRDTRAAGNAVFHLSDDGTTLEYRLMVANIDNVVAAHIHLGGVDAAGPVVAFLYGQVTVPPGGGRVQGVIVEGEITAADLIGPLTGQPLSALVAAIEAGNAYVNVHTNDGVGAVNTGPGDFPGGEIRGQME